MVYEKYDLYLVLKFTNCTWEIDTEKKSETTLARDFINIFTQYFFYVFLYKLLNTY